MEKSRTRWLITLLALIVTLSASAAEADPVVITSGSVSVVNGIDLPGFTLNGVNTSLTGILPIGGNLCCAFDAGELASLDRAFALSSLAGQPTAQMLNGTQYPSAYLTGTLAFTTVPFTVSSPGGSTFTFSTPFVASGHISGFADVARTVALFGADVTGAGTATVTGRRVSSSTLVGSELSFAFGPTQPSATPEPLSALLLATGLAAVFVRRRASA